MNKEFKSLLRKLDCGDWDGNLWVDYEYNGLCVRSDSKLFAYLRKQLGTRDIAIVEYKDRRYVLEYIPRRLSGVDFGSGVSGYGGGTEGSTPDHFRIRRA